MEVRPNVLPSVGRPLWRLGPVGIPPVEVRPNVLPSVGRPFVEIRPNVLRDPVEIMPSVKPKALPRNTELSWYSECVTITFC